MSAPGTILLCEKGHQFFRSEKGECAWEIDGKWIDIMEVEQQAKEKGCPCGSILSEAICHYGDINDCYDPPRYKQVDDESGFITWRVIL